MVEHQLLVPKLPGDPVNDGLPGFLRHELEDAKEAYVEFIATTPRLQWSKESAVPCWNGLPPTMRRNKGPTD